MILIEYVQTLIHYSTYDQLDFNNLDATIIIDSNGENSTTCVDVDHSLGQVYMPLYSTPPTLNNRKYICKCTDKPIILANPQV